MAILTKNNEMYPESLFSEFYFGETDKQPMGLTFFPRVPWGKWGENICQKSSSCWDARLNGEHEEQPFMYLWFLENGFIPVLLEYKDEKPLQSKPRRAVILPAKDCFIVLGDNTFGKIASALQELSGWGYEEYQVSYLHRGSEYGWGGFDWGNPRVFRKDCKLYNFFDEFEFKSNINLQAIPSLGGTKQRLLERGMDCADFYIVDRFSSKTPVWRDYRGALDRAYARELLLAPGRAETTS
jgi:hypothetical protein